MGRSPQRASVLAACAAVVAALVVPLPAQAAGEIYWFQLQTEDAVAAIRFYSNLFGWQIDTGPTGAFLMRRNGTPFASIAQIEDRIPNVSVDALNVSVLSFTASWTRCVTSIHRFPAPNFDSTISSPLG